MASPATGWNRKVRPAGLRRRDTPSSSLDSKVHIPSNLKRFPIKQLLKDVSNGRISPKTPAKARPHFQVVIERRIPKTVSETAVASDNAMRPICSTPVGETSTLEGNPFAGPETPEHRDGALHEQWAVSAVNLSDDAVTPEDQHHTSDAEETNDDELDASQPVFRAPRVRLPPRDDIRRVAAKMGWVNDWGMMSYLQLLVNSANIQSGRWECAVQDSMVLECHGAGRKGWRKPFGNPEDQSFDTSGLKTILLPYCTKQHWQLFLLDRERKEVRAYCSLGRRLVPADYKVRTTTIFDT